MRFAKVSVTILAILLISITVFSAFAQEGGDGERGGELYNTYCAMCHGPDGRGRIGANLENFPGIQADAAMSRTISIGISGSTMPAWSTEYGGLLTPDDIDDITFYLLDVLGGTRPVAPAPTYQPPEIPPLPDFEGDPTSGAIVFRENCEVCHGGAGEGLLGKTLAKNWAGNQPEVFIGEVVARGISGTIMPAWGKEAGGPLSEQQIMDVSAYILSLSPTAGLPQPEPQGEGPLGVMESLLIFGLLGVALLIGAILYYRKSGES